MAFDKKYFPEVKPSQPVDELSTKGEIKRAAIEEDGDMKFAAESTLAHQNRAIDAGRNQAGFNRQFDNNEPNNGFSKN